MLLEQKTGHDQGLLPQAQFYGANYSTCQRPVQKTSGQRDGCCICASCFVIVLWFHLTCGCMVPLFVPKLRQQVDPQVNLLCGCCFSTACKALSYEGQATMREQKCRHVYREWSNSCVPSSTAGSLLKFSVNVVDGAAS